MLLLLDHSSGHKDLFHFLYMINVLRVGRMEVTARTDSMKIAYPAGRGILAEKPDNNLKKLGKNMYAVVPVKINIRGFCTRLFASLRFADGQSEAVLRVVKFLTPNESTTCRRTDRKGLRIFPPSRLRNGHLPPLTPVLRHSGVFRRESLETDDSFPADDRGIPWESPTSNKVEVEFENQSDPRRRTPSRVGEEEKLSEGKRVEDQDNSR